MAYLMGIDLGTSSVKTLLMDYEGNIIQIAQQEYTFDIPHQGWAEQNPEIWWSATVKTINDSIVRAQIDPSEIKGISFSGQMHAMVVLDIDGKPVRNAIIWNDQRSTTQVEQIQKVIDDNHLSSNMCNRVATGFQIASLLWVKQNEPNLYDKIHTVLLPKDYIKYRLTDVLSTDITDAASTLAFDVCNGQWSTILIEALHMKTDYYTQVFLPHEFAGKITQNASAVTKLAIDTKVYNGGADQVMQAIGNGILEPGQVSVTIGTGAQVFAPIKSPIYDKSMRTHTFNYYENDKWYFMGASLCGGLSLKWLRDCLLDKISYQEMDNLARSIDIGSEGLVYLPYLSGERTPHMNPFARGLFFGLTLCHKKDHLIRATMEGVVFSLKDSLDILSELGETNDSVIASGGGAKSDIWLQMQADIFNKEVRVSKMCEQAALGAAICAGVGAGVYQSYKQACDKIIKWGTKSYLPNLSNVARYAEYNEIFKDLYQDNKDNMEKCEQLSKKYFCN